MASSVRGANVSEYVQRLMQTIPRAPEINDEFVARKLAEEAANKKRKAHEIGISAYFVSEVNSVIERLFLIIKSFPILF